MTPNGKPWDEAFMRHLAKEALLHCEATGLPFDFVNGDEQVDSFFSPSFDCVVPVKGYVEGNVLRVLFAVNQAKNVYTPDDLDLLGCILPRAARVYRSGVPHPPRNRS